LGILATNASKPIAKIRLKSESQNSTADKGISPTVLCWVPNALAWPSGDASDENIVPEDKTRLHYFDRRKHQENRGIF